MIRQPLQLERDGTDRLPPRRRASPGERLERATIGTAVPDHRISGDRLRDEHPPLSAHALQQSFHATMLVAEHDLEKQHLLAVRLKPEMPGLDDPRMYGADGQFMHFVPSNLKERVRLAIRHRDVPPRWEMIGRVPPQRLERRMTLGKHAALFRELALEGMRLGAGRRERRIAIADDGARHTQLPLRVVRQDRHEARSPTLFRGAEERGDAPTASDRVRHRLPKAFHRLDGDRGKRNGAPVAQAGFPQKAHGAVPPSAMAARVRTSRNGPGM